MSSQLLPSRYANPTRIGHGGMGEIFMAEDQVLGRRVAVKLLNERYGRDVGIRKRFTREATTAARLSGHPHIVTIFDVGECHGRPLIVMEYMPGGTVSERARSGKLERAQALEWLRQAAEALDHAHDRGVVHRDVKPANLLIDDRGNLKVGDFGIARMVDETTGGMTAAGTVLGTAGYLSPEQARGEPATFASDVYALGIVAYELLTGGRPFQGMAATAEAAAHIHQPVPRASERGVGLPLEVDDVFERVLAKDPAARYPTNREFVRALGSALAPREERTKVAPAPVGAAAAPAPTRKAPEPRRPARKGNRPFVPAVLAGLLIAAALAGIVVAAVVTGSDERPREEAQTAPPAPSEVTVTAEGPGTTVVSTVITTTPPPPPATVTPPPPPPPAGAANLSVNDGIRLTDESTALIRQGSYGEALPIARRALAALEGSGHTYEAYANYNVGISLIKTGNCSAGLPHIDRSEALQGHRSEFDSARAECS